MHIPSNDILEMLSTTDLVVLWEQAYDEGMPGTAAEPPGTRPALLEKLGKVRGAWYAQLATEFEVPMALGMLSEPEARAAADQYLHALRRVRDELQANELETQALLRAYQERHGRRQAKLAAREEFFLSALERLLGMLPLRGKQSVTLLAGRIGTRKRGGRWHVTDAAALLSWAREQQPELIERKVEERVPAATVADYCERIELDHELAMPGVEWIAEHRAFYADPDEEETPPA